VAQGALTDRDIHTWFVRDVLAGSGASGAGVTRLGDEPMTDSDDIYRLLKRHGAFATGDAYEQVTTMLTTFRTNLRALYQYRAPRSELPIVQLRATKSGLDELARHPHAHRDDWGWGHIVGDRVEIITLPGDHYSVLQSAHVGALAAKMTEIFDRQHSAV
jgi:thioesterase domain-containing protein